MDVLTKLIELLAVEAVETNVYLGQSQDLGFKAVFGGQVLGQSIMAAKNTVEGRVPHSLHAYFLRPGWVDEPIFYEVDMIRTGASFTTRRVVAKQGGRAIFNLAVSFQKPEEGFDHQAEKPSVPGPDGLPSELELLRKVQHKIPEKLRDKFTCDRPIEIRVLDPVDNFRPHKRPAKKYSWFRAVHEVPNDPMIQSALLAYASDYGLATTAMLPHGVTFFDPSIQIASIDHAMWFHRPINMSDWHLYEKDSTSASGGRGFNRGSIYSQDGTLVASVAQESLIRRREKPQVSDKPI
ncbi:MAG: acyl-CoA thioesterase II [Pseudobacteriovorax sp.]|nr:acyl-CoA thioesterase II [Pseudobacteriovorax sp.]